MPSSFYVRFLQFTTLLYVMEYKVTFTNQQQNRESEGICFYRRWFVCLSVCLSVTTITKKIVDGFVLNFMGRFVGLGDKTPKFSFRGKLYSLRVLST